MKQKARNREIAKAYAAGESLRTIAERYGISPSRVSYIARNEGVRLGAQEYVRRYGVSGAANARRADVRARISNSIRQRWCDGTRMGRPTLFAGDPVKRADYLNLRKVYGAKYARQVMGIGA